MLAGLTFPQTVAQEIRAGTGSPDLAPRACNSHRVVAHLVFAVADLFHLAREQLPLPVACSPSTHARQDLYAALGELIGKLMGLIFESRYFLLARRYLSGYFFRFRVGPAQLIEY